MTIRIGAVGLGRLGYQHAYNLKFVIRGLNSLRCAISTRPS